MIGSNPEGSLRRFAMKGNSASNAWRELNLQVSHGFDSQPLCTTEVQVRFLLTCRCASAKEGCPW